MARAAIGFRVHSGWAAMVAVTLENGLPIVLERRKLLLVKTFSYTFRQPYHTAANMPLANAANFIREMETESQALALAGIRHLQKDLAKVDMKVAGCALLLASGRALPNLEGILASHALIHTADGELFRASIRNASKRAKLPLIEMKERELIAAVANRFNKRPQFLLRHVAALGKTIGPPWTQDEKLATLAACLPISK